MEINSKYILILLLLICGISLFSGTVGRPMSDLSSNQIEINLQQDTGTLYPVTKTQITNYEDLTKKNPIDLRTPSNIQTEIEYDLNNNIYLFKTKIDNDEWITPFTLDPQQYSKYSLKKAMSDYFKLKNAEAFSKGEKKSDFSLRDIRVNAGALERIFGPGGVQIKTQGYVELSAGIKHSKTDNPTLSPKNRSRLMFDFDEKIQMNASASIGNKMDFGLNYDTESTFDFDTKRIKLAYEGEEDEIIKHLEAGNVSMNTTNSLINGGSSLFGVKADLQFGKLRINSVISQQNGESQTVNTQGGIQTMPFEFKADQYDENQHFFFGYYFRDKFDEGMSKAPFIRSNILIDKVQVWVTNKQGNFDKARNIIAFADLAESDSIKNKTLWRANSSSIKSPFNTANNLYLDIKNTYSNSRDINQASSVLTSIGLENGLDYEKLESARMLDASEYIINQKLGYISLKTPLASDQVLAIAFQYTSGGVQYKVGEFAHEILSGALFVKLLKPVSMSPSAYTWDLMMKNVYKLGSSQIQKDKFRLNIYYQSDTAGTYISYIPAGNIKDKLLLNVLGLDRLNSLDKEVSNGDGIFDFLDGLTILPENGRVIFPVVEPFGSHLRKKIGNDAVASKYVFQELYDSTLTVAQQVADKNKFKISGSYKTSGSNSLINLNAMNVARGSVRVTANGTPLTENVDYTVDYTAGVITIINQSILDANTPISVSLEDQSLYNMKRKTLLGLNLSYEFSKNFNIGATVMHMYEKPLTVKTGIGGESLKNTLWGMNFSYQTSSQWLTNLIDKVPFINATAPSQISLNGEFAQLIAGHYENGYGGGYSYLDDFESATTKLSILRPIGWKLASTPSGNFIEAKLIGATSRQDSLQYGNNRAHLAWFTIDNLFTRKNYSLTPSHIKNDKDELSNHFVRAINVREIYPERDVQFNETATISALNLSYYPQQRGVYNLDSERMDSDGKLLYPKDRWGGMMRKLDNTNFETSNIEYIEFWLMDPFVYNGRVDSLQNNGGDLYFELGEISEDILKDGKKFYENGLPTDANPTEVINTPWGKVPLRQSTVYAFDNNLSLADRIKQDAGLNGMTTDEEKQYEPYVNYMNALRAKLNSEALARMNADPHSPLNDPSGDNYAYFRGADLDRNKVRILDRYKYINGTEGNSTASDLSDSNYASSATSLPDVEDLNQDYTMNESENFYQYKVILDPTQMNIDNPYITDSRMARVDTPNGVDSVRWFQFKIPIKTPHKTVGNIRDFKTIRFMRMFLTNFAESTFLRFASLDLVRGQWRVYTQPLKDGGTIGNSTINVSSVNLEENSNKKPVSYVSPPGVSRITDPSQAQLKLENEQALSIKVLNLAPEEARAIYKNTSYDLRKYKRLQMFTHAEALADGPDLRNSDVTVFLRLGSDYKNNYYEYEIPLVVTPAGEYNYNNNVDRETVWPKANMFDFPLEVLTKLKLNRNKEKRKSGSKVSYTALYTEEDSDPDKAGNKISIIGNPSLSDISVMMIGIRNNDRRIKSAEVWVNELRLTDYDEEGGWAAQGNLNIALSDIATVTLTGRKETAGFGAIDQSLMQRRNDDYSTYTISTSVNLGRLLPEQAKITAPLFYSYSNQTITPRYDPLDQDIKLKDALDVVNTKQEKDSIKNLAQDKTITKNFSLSNIRLNVQSKEPMPYDPANFTFGYASSKTETTNPTTVYDLIQNYKASMGYSYSPAAKRWEPFKNNDSKSPWMKYPKSLGINFLPNNVSFNSNITRYFTRTITRDLESFTLGGNNNSQQFSTFSQNFYWDRDFSLSWDLLKNLKMNIQTGTRAEIEEPYIEANKKIYTDEYDRWKDGIIRNLHGLGNPLSYRQNTQVTYTLPFLNIPILDWINSAANYSSAYSWDRGAQYRENVEDETSELLELGNTITNSMTINLSNRFELIELYNKSSFLKKVNDKFGSSSGRRNSQRLERERPERAKKPFQQDVRLNLDSGTIVNHNLKTKNILVTAKLKGKTIKLKYKRIDENRIRINLKDTLVIKLNVVDKGPTEETTLYKIAQYGARGLMSVRSVSVNYSLRNETAVAGFRPGIGNFFGQKGSDYGMSPGVGFAFGLDGGESFIDKSLANGWMVINGENISPAVYNSIRKLELEAQLEPARGLKIRLNALREKTERTSFDFSAYSTSNPNMLRSFGGSFAMTTISLSSSFGSGNAKNNYKSKAFDKFLGYTEILAERMKNKYSSLKYPNKGFLQGVGYVGDGNNMYDPQNGDINQNSADILIPAFLAAYTNKNANKISFSPFPALSSILPNWSISYDGLTTLPWFKDKFRNFRLMHSYISQYRIGSYASFLTWVEADNGGDFGFIKGLDTDSNSPMATPSSKYDISSVSIIEQFNPLFGADGTLNNNLTFNARYNYSRMLNLNTTSFQLIETLQKDFVIGMGYKINEFNKLIGLPIKNNKGFNNDLTIKGDLSRRSTQSLIRKIEDRFTEATSGTTILTIKLSAEYTLSRSLLLRMYFDRTVNSPLISSSSYPTANSNFGISLRFTLTQ